MSDYSDKQRAKKRDSANPVVSVINKVTPGGYTVKQKAWGDFYEGEFPLDWDAINAADPHRLIFQVTVGRHGRHGDDEPDRAVKTYIEQSKSEGRKYGLYHLLTPHSITEQMDFYCRNVDLLCGWGNMPPILDIEYEPPKGRDTFRGTAWAGEIKAALDILQTRSGLIPLIYWSKKFASYTADRYGNLPSWMGDYWHWIAGYLWTPYVDSYYDMPQTYLPSGIGFMLAGWQYAEDGRYRGKFANDLSVVYDRYVDYLERNFA